MESHVSTNINYIKPTVVAEHCCNHMGDLDLAKKMVKTAVLRHRNEPRKKEKPASAFGHFSWENL